MAAEWPGASGFEVDFLQLEVEMSYSDILDRFGPSQDEFFAACTQYADGPLSALLHDTVEDSEAELETALVVAISSITAKQPDITTGLYHAHEFVVATDALRIEHLRPLAPQQLFIAYRESILPGAFKQDLPGLLKKDGAEKTFRDIVSQALNGLRYDMDVFCESVATGRAATNLERAIQTDTIGVNHDIFNT